MTIISKGSKTLRTRYFGTQTIRTAQSTNESAVLRIVKMLSNARVARRQAIARSISTSGSIMYGGKTMEARYFGVLPISAVYYGEILVWEAVNSCFGAGFWNNAKPWSNIDAWKNKN